jgi:hypothetical protein
MEPYTLPLLHELIFEKSRICYPVKNFDEKKGG